MIKSLDTSNFKITGGIESPINLDYDILGLHKKRTVVKGELITIEYYRNFDGVTYTDLVLTETRQFIRNEIGMVMYRNLNITWYLEDDSIGITKSSIKFYTPQESIEEGMNRRGNMIAEGKLYILGTVGLVNGQDFLASITNEVSLFVNGATQPLRDAINASVKPYITQVIKDSLIVIFTF